jgi:hypothetical protein
MWFAALAHVNLFDQHFDRNPTDCFGALINARIYYWDFQHDGSWLFPLHCFGKSLKNMFRVFKKFLSTLSGRAATGIFSRHFPMQKVLKVASSKSSVAVRPTISPTALAAIRKSIATSSSVASARNASAALARVGAVALQRVLMPRVDGHL